MGGVQQNNQAPVGRASKGGVVVKLKKVVYNFLANSIPMSMYTRAKIYRRLGAKIGKDCLLGKVSIDGIYPQDVVIGDGCTITTGTVLLTHFYDTKNLSEHAYYRGQICIGNHCYVGMNTIFSKPVTVGDGAVIGAGSVVTKDIPPYEVWAGVPARFICKRYSDPSEIPASPDEFKSR